MAITWDNVEGIAPDLKGKIPQPTQTFILTLVGKLVAERNWQELRDEGMTLLAAHFGTLFKPGQEGHGPVSDQSAGGLSQSYGDMTSFAKDLGLTSFGSQYLALLRLTPAALGLVVGECDVY